MGRAKCSYSKKIKQVLKKKTKKLFYFESNKVGEKIDKKYLKLNFDYIFCFRSFYILKKSILKKVKKGEVLEKLKLMENYITLTKYLS